MKADLLDPLAMASSWEFAKEQLPGQSKDQESCHEPRAVTPSSGAWLHWLIEHTCRNGSQGLTTRPFGPCCFAQKGPMTSLHHVQIHAACINTIGSHSALRNACAEARTD